jgi:hypothetical protein
MKTRITPIALALGLMLAGSLSAEAQGWQRNRSTTGPNGGQWGTQGSGSCAGGSCASQQRWTGPRGATATRSGKTTCGGGSCNGTATYTGPRGQSATRTRSATRN